MKPCKVNKI